MVPGHIMPTPKPQRAQGGKGGQQIAHHAQQAAQQHGFGQVQFPADFSVQHSGDSHGKGKQTGAGQIAHGFGHAESRLCKRGRPLCHSRFRCPGTDHQQNHHPQQRQPKQLSKGQTFPFLHQALHGTGEKQKDINQRCQGPKHREYPPIFRSKHSEKEGRA